jgi:hypothetical protein
MGVCLSGCFFAPMSRYVGVFPDVFAADIRAANQLTSEQRMRTIATANNRLREEPLGALAMGILGLGGLGACHQFW